MSSFAGKILHKMKNTSGVEIKHLNAIVTGSNGFIGRTLSRYLLECGANVVGLGTQPAPANLPTGLRYYQTDIIDFERLNNTIIQTHLEDPVIFHLAGQNNVGKSRTDPLFTWIVNVTGTANLLETCRRTSIKRIVFPSTALIYSRPTRLPIVETDAVMANGIYASTKLAAEALIKSYSVDFGFNCCIARLGNVYGPGGASDSVVEIILRQVKNGGPISLRTLTSVRDFVYCEDVARGLTALAVHANIGSCETFNLSSGTPTSIRELVETACLVGGLETTIIETNPFPPGGNDKLVVSIQRLKEHTGWQPVWTLESGLRQTLLEME